MLVFPQRSRNRVTFRGYPPTMARSNIVDNVKINQDNIIQSLASTISNSLSNVDTSQINLAAVATNLANLQVGERERERERDRQTDRARTIAELKKIGHSHMNIGRKLSLKTIIN